MVSSEVGRKGIRDEVLWAWYWGRGWVVVRLDFSLRLPDAKAPLRRVGIEGFDIVYRKELKRSGYRYNSISG